MKNDDRFPDEDDLDAARTAARTERRVAHADRRAQDAEEQKARYLRGEDAYL